MSLHGKLLIFRNFWPEIWASLCVSLQSGEYVYHLPDEKREFILVSRGSTIIRIQRESMIEMGVMKSILSETKHFPSDDDISATFMIQNEWRYFKKVTFVSKKLYSNTSNR